MENTSDNWFLNLNNKDLSPIESINDLNRKYSYFIEEADVRMMISAGLEDINYFKEKYDYFSGRAMYANHSFLKIKHFEDISLIETLYNNKSKIIIMNEDALLDQQSSSIIKKAITNDDLVYNDSHFKFSGKILIITQMSIEDIYMGNNDISDLMKLKPIISDMFLTVEDIIELIEFNLDKNVLYDIPRMDNDKYDVLDFLKANIKSLNPFKFNIYSFLVILEKKHFIERINKYKQILSFSEIIGKKKKDWKKETIRILE
ncbi:MAG: hypothetical protein WCS34_08825 [Bacteroidales bacterium]